jgi:hypothetical protein
MGGKLRAITQVSFALLLALSLSLVTAVSVMAVEFPSISPETAEYDLDDPAEVMTTIDWGSASSHPIIEKITDDQGDLEEGLNKDYIVLVKHLIILNSYLEGKLTDIGDEVELIVQFDVGAASFTITATGTQPSISPTTADYDLDDPVDIETTITWGTATTEVSISENGNLLTQGVDYTKGATVGGEATLTILDAYLASELTDIGDEVVLTIDFDVGTNATLTITAIGTQPYIDPVTAEYDLDDPTDVETTVKRGTAIEVVSIVDGDSYELVENVDYNLSPFADDTATLVIFDDSYLEDKLTDIGESVVLTINFNVGANATFTITAVGVQPKVSPQTEEYDVENPTNVTTTITWNTAKNVTSIMDGDNYALVEDEDYSVIPDTNKATLTIFDDSYLEDKLKDIGDKVVLTINFDLGADATFTITATGIQPSISPATGTYDILEWNDVTTTITWGSAKSVVSIVDDDGLTLADGIDYTVTDISLGVSANLTILSSTYLKDKLKEFGEEVVLTIGFDVGNDANLIISAPEICFIATAAYGTPMAAEIQILREFRDEYLLTNPLGQALVGTYYRVSPPIAQFIIDHPSLRPLVRAGLLPVVAMSTVAVNTTPVEKTAIVSSLVLVSVALAVWAIRRRGRGPEYT